MRNSDFFDDFGGDFGGLEIFSKFYYINGNKLYVFEFYLFLLF